ncbi:hypothetical protein EZBTHKR_1576 [Elizabethkingia anophelis]|nr:hypothetical protein EZBTHKR_1576 [Elizabethkingia anophelis]
MGYETFIINTIKIKFITGNTLKYFSLKFSLFIRRKLKGKEKTAEAIINRIPGVKLIC